MITITDLWKAFGAQDLFTGAELRVGARERVALVGPNGSGKTTLFEMLAGTESPDRGAVAVLKQADVGLLRQDSDALAGRSLLEEVCSAATHVHEAQHTMAVLEAELAGGAEGKERERLLAEYAELHDRLADLDAYSTEHRAKAILGGLGFGPAAFARPVESFSGGQLMRVSLAKLLLAAPDLLMLDEPTNHLDVEAVEWLERFLVAYRGTVFFVSHDRDFINGMATRVVAIERGRLVSSKGDYEAYLAQRELAARQAEAAEANAARDAERAQEFIDRFRAKATKARQVQSRIRQLEKAAPAPPRQRVRRSMGIAFPAPPRAGRVVLELKGVSFAYGDTPVYEGLNLAVERSQKIALVGPNGAGKSTLLKLLAGVLEPRGGERVVGHNAAVAYLSQHAEETLSSAGRVLDEVADALPPGAALRPGDLLGRFLFSGDDLRKPVGVLSGGERTRLAIAKLLARPLNALLLDEPTNHLDIASRDALEGALVDYQGALVLITHDRHLIRSVVNHIVEVRDGRLRIYGGDYDSYLARRDDAAPASPAAPARVAVSSGTAAERRRESARSRATIKSLRASLARVDAELERVSGEVAAISAQLADPGVYASGADIAALVAGYEATTRRVRQLEAQWEEAAGLLEAQGASV